MLRRAYWQFYKSIFPFIAIFSILVVMYVGLAWGFVLFATIGLLFGFIGFWFFYNDQFYFYYNLGLSKKRLFLSSFFINILVGVPIFSILIVFISFIFGDIQIT